MVDKTYGQYRKFVSQYGGGAQGVENYARQLASANPSITFGDFYASYVLGTGNVNKPFSVADLKREYPDYYQNLVRNAGVDLNTPLSQMLR
jgi:hypothetical protein